MILYFALGLALGLALRQPAVCQRQHLPRHLDPAIVDREDDEGILPPDPRTWPDSGTITGTTWPTWTATSAPPVSATWPETLEHEGDHVPGEWLVGCRRCDALRWQRR